MMLAMREKHIHFKIIESFGGIPALAKKLGYSTERVCNWAYRGIPSKEILKNRKLFKKKLFDNIGE